MFVFIGKLSLSTLRWIPMCQGFSNFSGFLYHIVLVKLATSSIGIKGLVLIYWLSILLTLPMLRLLLPKAQWCKDFWKPSKPCHVGIHWIALTEYSQMSTHLPEFRSFLRFFASFCNGQISHQQHRGKRVSIDVLTCYTLMLLVADLANTK